MMTNAVKDDLMRLIKVYGKKSKELGELDHEASYWTDKYLGTVDCEQNKACIKAAGENSWALSKAVDRKQDSIDGVLTKVESYVDLFVKEILRIQKNLNEAYRAEIEAKVGITKGGN